MSQNDYVIANQTTPLFRTDLNLALQALASNSSGSSAPVTTYANMMWYDTTANILKMRNEADSAWINLGTLDQGANTFTPSGGISASTDPDFTVAPTSFSNRATIKAHVDSVAEGAAGATRIAARAMLSFPNGQYPPPVAVTAGTTYNAEIGMDYVVGTLVNSSSVTIVVAATYTDRAYTGTMRFSASHKQATNSLGYLYFYKNNVLAATFSTINTFPTARTVDSAVAVNDVFEWRHKAGISGTSTISDIFVTSSTDAYFEVSPVMLRSEV